MQKIQFDKLLILSVFSAHIYDREDFENPEKHLRLKDNLEQTDYLANLSLDQEHNLCTLAPADKGKKKDRLIANYEFCSREDYWDVSESTTVLRRATDVRIKSRIIKKQVCRLFDRRTTA